MPPGEQLRDPARLFLWTGVLRRGAMAGGWVPLSVRFVSDLEFSATQLLLLGVAIELGLVLFEIPTGVVADRWSRKWSVVIGTLILGGAQFASGIVSVHWGFLITQFIWGIGWTFLSGAEVAWLTDELGSVERTERLILRRARWQFIGMVISTLVLAAVGHWWSLQAAVLIPGAIGLLWALVLATFMTERGFDPTAAPASARSAITQGWSAVRSSRALVVLATALLIGGIAAETIDRTDIRRLADLGLSDSISPVAVYGVVWLGQSLLAALMLWKLETRLTGSGGRTGLAVLFVVTGVGVALVAHVTLLAVVVAILVAQGSLLDLSDPLIVAWTNEGAPSAVRATVHSFIGQVRAAGEIIGGVVLGVVAAAATLPTALTIAAMLFGVAGLIATGRSALISR